MTKLSHSILNSAETLNLYIWPLRIYGGSLLRFMPLWQLHVLHTICLVISTLYCSCCCIHRKTGFYLALFTLIYSLIEYHLLKKSFRIVFYLWNNQKCQKLLRRKVSTKDMMTHLSLHHVTSYLFTVGKETKRKNPTNF